MQVLTPSLVDLREDALAIARASAAAVDAGACVDGARDRWRPLLMAAPRWHVMAIGKAAVPMMRACLAGAPTDPATALVVAPALDATLPALVEQRVGGHPVPTERSVAAGRRALALASAAGTQDVLLVLLSGGASALAAVPVAGITLGDKRATTSSLLRAGADIHALNTVRKHLSSLKGGRLASATSARTFCLVISDVIGDDLSVIGSGPTVADPSTYAEALAVLERYGGRGAFPPPVVAWLERGALGGIEETPKPGAAALRRADTIVIGDRTGALAGGKIEAERRGYDVVVEAAPVSGEARLAAAGYADRTCARLVGRGRPLCILSAGETTVHVTGRGTGGRNQEFALALAEPLAACPRLAVVVSLGTDGVDGPTDAAGALVDTTTAARASAIGGRSIRASLDDNDAYHFFQALGDLIITGPTGTNVGDVQVALMAAGGDP